MKFIFKTLDPLYSATAGTSCVPHHIHIDLLLDIWLAAAAVACSFMW